MLTIADKMILMEMAALLQKECDKLREIAIKEKKANSIDIAGDLLSDAIYNIKEGLIKLSFNNQ